MKYLNRVLIFIFVLANISCKEIQGPQGPPGSSGIEALTDPSIMPKIIYIYPPANSQGPYEDFSGNQMIVRFNKIMDRTSVKRALSLISPQGDLRIDTQQIYQRGGDEFILYPRLITDDNYIYSYKWKLGQSYLLSIAASAKDVNGNSLDAYSMTFLPEPYFRITRNYPENSSTGINTSPSIYLYLNSPVDTTIFSSIQITPAIKGKWEYMYGGYYGYTGDSTGLRYSYEEALPLNTTYILNIHTTAKDKYGNPLAQEFVSRFTTSIFKVTNTSPVNGSSDIISNSSINVRFSGSIDTGTVRNAIKISPFVEGKFYMNYNSEFYFYPTDGLLPNTMYTVTIDTSLRSKDGLSILNPYIFSFTTAPFKISSVYPYDGISYVPLSENIFVAFTQDLDTGTVRNALHISPETAGILSTYGNSFSYKPSNGLFADTMYVVTIDTSIRSKSGKKIPTQYTFSFRTGPFRVTNTNPSNGSIGISRYLYSIVIDFNAPIDTGTVRSAFTIPGITGTYYFYNGSSRFYFYPDSTPLPSSATYTGTVSTAMKSRAGASLKAPYKFTFITGP